MDSFELMLAIILVAVVAFQSWLTYRVFRSTMFDRRQKVLQAQLIWLVPILGAGMVFTVLREERPSDPPSTSRSA